MRRLLPLLALVLISTVGCSSEPGKNPDPFEVTGTVKLKGVPLSDVVLNLLPTTPGAHPVAPPLTDGKFKVLIAPGSYSYYISEGKSPSAFKAIPNEYRLPSTETRDEIVIEAGTPTIEINIE